MKIDGTVYNKNKVLRFKVWHNISFGHANLYVVIVFDTSGPSGLLKIKLFSKLLPLETALFNHPDRKPAFQQYEDWLQWVEEQKGTLEVELYRFVVNNQQGFNLLKGFHKSMFIDDYDKF